MYSICTEDKPYSPEGAGKRKKRETDGGLDFRSIYNACFQMAVCLLHFCSSLMPTLLSIWAEYAVHDAWAMIGLDAK